MNAVNKQKETFVHLLLRQGHFEFTCQLLQDHMAAYNFDCELLDSSGGSIKVSFGETCNYMMM